MLNMCCSVAYRAVIMYVRVGVHGHALLTLVLSCSEHVCSSESVCPYIDFSTAYSVLASYCCAKYLINELKLSTRPFQTCDPTTWY